MKLTQTTLVNRKSGMTLIELTVVIVVLLALIAVLFVGAKAYKDGADKAACIMNQRNIQQAARSWANLNPNGAWAADGASIFGAGLFIEVAPQCPAAKANYTMAAALPDIGTLVCTCPNDPVHIPTGIENW